MTGANVSLFIGPFLLTEAFGISWQEMETLNPEYGYNSKYYNFVSEGQVMCMGNLFLNFVHASYLPIVLQRYHNFLGLARDAIRANQGDGLVALLESRAETANLVNLIRAFVDPNVRSSEGYTSNTEYYKTGTYGTPEFLNSAMTMVNPGGSRIVAPLSLGGQRSNNNASNITDVNAFENNTQLSRNIDVGLNAIFSSPEVRNDMISFFTGGLVTSQSVFEEPDGSITSRSDVVSFDRLQEMVDRSIDRRGAGGANMIWANPRQFGAASQGARAIDITVHYGPPGGLTEENKVYNYSKSSSIMFKGVRFTGESGILRNDDQPLLESYPFIARRKVILPSSYSNEPGVANL